MTDVRFLPGHMLVNRYRIVRMLGAGGMGEVYEAQDLNAQKHGLPEQVALKFLRWPKGEGWASGGDESGSM